MTELLVVIPPLYATVPTRRVKQWKALWFGSGSRSTRERDVIVAAGK